jgi:hypothetical protein
MEYTPATSSRESLCPRATGRTAIYRTAIVVNVEPLEVAHQVVTIYIFVSMGHDTLGTP